MSAIINRETITRNLTNEDRERIYREVLKDYTKQDILARAEDIDREVSEAQAEYLAYLWAYTGEYDCNLSYWDNIDNLIENYLDLLN